MSKDSRFRPLDETGQMIERPRAEHLLEVRFVSLRRPVACPHCGSGRTRIYCSKSVVGTARARYHICDDCNETFKTASEEQES